MIRVLIVNRRFDVGGAERQLISLLRGIDKSRFDIVAASFYSGGDLASELEAIPGMRWVSLGKRGRWDIARMLLHARRLGKSFRPHVVYGYMGPAQFVALILGKLSGAKTIWALRASNVKWQEYGLLSRFSFWLERFLSHHPDLIIANSYAGKEHAVSLGFPESKIIVIPNGIDTDVFRPDPEARTRLHAEWGIAEDEHLIGLVARLDPMKDHPTFLKAASALAKEKKNVRFVCVGDGPVEYKLRLQKLASAINLDGRLIWAGRRHDMVGVYNALDIATASSIGEGFSNAIGEAMACGTPCVVTDVGDSAKVVGDAGEVVEAADPVALAGGWRKLLDRLEHGDYAEHSCRVEKLRGHIQKLFGKNKMIQESEAAFCMLASANN